MSLLLAGSTHRADIAAALASVPFSVGGWFKKSETSATARNMWSQGTSGQDNQRWSVEQGSGLDVRATARTTGSDSSNGATVNDSTIWHHVLAVYTSATSRNVYVDGVDGGNNTASRAPTGAGYTVFGRSTLGGAEIFPGRLAHWGMWASALTQTDATNLSTNARIPTLVGSPFSYWDFASTANDLVGSNHLTVTGATFDADNPTVVTTLSFQAAWARGINQILQAGR